MAAAELVTMVAPFSSIKSRRIWKVMDAVENSREFMQSSRKQLKELPGWTGWTGCWMSSYGMNSKAIVT